MLPNMLSKKSRDSKRRQANQNIHNSSGLALKGQQDTLLLIDLQDAIEGNNFRAIKTINNYIENRQIDLLELCVTESSLERKISKYGGLPRMEAISNTMELELRNNIISLFVSAIHTDAISSDYIMNIEIFNFILSHPDIQKELVKVSGEILKSFAYHRGFCFGAGKDTFNLTEKIRKILNIRNFLPMALADASTIKKPLEIFFIAFYRYAPPAELQTIFFQHNCVRVFVEKSLSIAKILYSIVQYRIITNKHFRDYLMIISQESYHETKKRCITMLLCVQRNNVLPSEMVFTISKYDLLTNLNPQPTSPKALEQIFRTGDVSKEVFATVIPQKEDQRQTVA